MTGLELFGLLAGFLFAYAAVPTTIRTIRAGKHLGTPLDIIVAILAGTVTMYSYLLISYGFNWVLALNYTVELVSWAILLAYRLWRKDGLDETRETRQSS